MILTTLYLTSQFVKELKNQERGKMQLVKQLSLEEKEEMKIWSDAVSKMASSPAGQEIDPCILELVKSNNSIPAIWVSSNNKFKDCRNIDPREFELNKEIEVLKMTPPTKINKVPSIALSR